MLIFYLDFFEDFQSDLCQLSKGGKQQPQLTTLTMCCDKYFPTIFPSSFFCLSVTMCLRIFINFCQKYFCQYFCQPVRCQPPADNNQTDSCSISCSGFLYISNGFCWLVGWDLDCKLAAWWELAKQPNDWTSERYTTSHR